MGGPNQGNAGRGGRGGRGPGGQQMQRVNVNVPNQGGNRGQPVKFNQQARNAGMQAQQPPPQQQSIPQANESLTASALASATPEMQKNMVGERLYPLIHQTQPELAGKITGMLLEMDNSDCSICSKVLRHLREKLPKHCRYLMHIVLGVLLAK